MINKDKVIWSEGMLLRQQHFQQQERYFIQQLKLAAANTLPDNYGFYELTLAYDLLSLQKISLVDATGVFPDGTHFTLGWQANAVLEPLIITNNTFDQVIYLCLPLEAQILPRYKHAVCQIQDDSQPNAVEVDVVVGKLNLQLRTSEDDLSQFTTLAVAKIKYCNEIDGIILEENFMIPALNCHVVLELKQSIEEMVGLIEQRIKIIASRVAAPSRQYVADLKELLLLQTLNRYHLIWKHAASRLHQHPIFIYNMAIQLLSELSTFTNEKKYCDFETSYQQSDLYQTFSPLFHTLRQQLNRTIEHTALAISLEKTPQGWWQSTALNGDIFDNCQLVLAAKADLPHEELQARFLTQVKVAPADKMVSLLHSQLPGLTFTLLATIPPTIPYHAGYVYFLVNSESALWQDLKSFGQLAIHATAQLPHLDLNCWIIRS